MIVIMFFLGVVLAVCGVILYRKSQKVIGTLIFIIGGSLASLALVALLDFHL
jgi:cytochrome b subunit of formate dehydrogenase